MDGAEGGRGHCLPASEAITNSPRAATCVRISARWRGSRRRRRLLPEQIWDLPDKLEALLYYGRPTGAAMPLMWAHAEYIKLLRSTADGHILSLIHI